MATAARSGQARRIRSCRDPPQASVGIVVDVRDGSERNKLNVSLPYFLIRRIRLMTMTFITESASESFSVVSAVIIAALAAIVMTGFWEFLFQEIKRKRHEQKCRRMQFGRAVERLQKLDGNRMGNTPIVDRVTQGPVSDLPRIRSARSSAKGNVQGRDLPVSEIPTSLASMCQRCQR